MSADNERANDWAILGWVGVLLGIAYAWAYWGSWLRVAFGLLWAGACAYLFIKEV